jgi:beta-N-acetylhexosaminidase
MSAHFIGSKAVSMWVRIGLVLSALGLTGGCISCTNAHAVDHPTNGPVDAQPSLERTKDTMLRNKNLVPANPPSRGISMAAATNKRAPVTNPPPHQTSTQTSAQAPRKHVGPVNGVDIEAILQRLTLEEKVGQMLFLGFGGKVMDESIARFLKKKKPGGVALFGRNIKDSKQTATLIRAVREYDPAGIPMFVSVDQEGGKVVRLKRNTTVIPSNMALGATRDPDLAKQAGASLGRDLRLLGFNMNLAPVLDVNSNPNNPVIGIRSFGEDPALVGEMGVAYIRGLQSEGISAVAKHFPGHGDTASDSHFSMPSIAHTKARLMEVDLVPFSLAMTDGLDAIMTAHIALPNIAEEKDMPATVSHNVITGLLRNEFGYDGLVITDGLEMKGIVEKYGSGEAAVRAVVAGADMVMVLWFPEKKDEVHRMLLEAVREGRISPLRLEQAVRHVLTAKAKRGIFNQKLPSIPAAMSALKQGSHRKVVSEVAKRAITLVKNQGGVLPLDQYAGQQKNIVVVSTEPSFLAEIKKKFPKARYHQLKASPSKSQLRREKTKVQTWSKKADLLVVGLLDSVYVPMVKRIKEKHSALPVAVVSFGSPYLMRHFPNIDAYLCAYGFRWASEVAAARAVLGTEPPTGLLPVSLPGGPGFGHSMAYAQANGAANPEL